MGVRNSYELHKKRIKISNHTKCKRNNFNKPSLIDKRYSRKKLFI